MTPILAVILVCAAAVAPADCTPVTALEVRAIPVPTPFACLMTGQVTLAREAAGAAGDGRYAVTRCERRGR